MNVDWGSCLVVLLVWWLGTGPSHGQTDNSKSGNTSTLVPSPETTRKAARSHHLEDDIQVGCRQLRAKRYISDGFCTSTKPINEVVCAGNCLPIRQLPWYSEFVKYWSNDKLREWECEEDMVRRKKVRLLCQDKTYRTYKIKVVKSCKCKKTVDEHNKTKQRKKKKKRRRRKNNKNNRRQKGKTHVSSNAP
ncbi:sclerostin domain-containing protein 1-like [Haliotis cracherodii]|uniref:sclerostin domain-containing protein 1-like n=1 Tax=Haliotis cracherodii TaxID=6455 RepID=UPI0039EAD132